MSNGAFAENLLILKRLRFKIHFPYGGIVSILVVRSAELSWVGLSETCQGLANKVKYNRNINFDSSQKSDQIPKEMNCYTALAYLFQQCARVKKTGLAPPFPNYCWVEWIPIDLVVKKKEEGFKLEKVDMENLEEGDILFVKRPGKSTVSHCGLVCVIDNVKKIFHSSLYLPENIVDPKKFFTHYISVDEQGLLKDPYKLGRPNQLLDMRVKEEPLVDDWKRIRSKWRHGIGNNGFYLPKETVSAS